MLRKLLVCICGVMLTGSVTAQSAEEFEAIRKTYPDDEACIFSDREVLDIDLKKGKLKITSSLQRKTMLLTDRANQFAQQKISYISDMEEFTRFKAESYIPENNKYRKIEVEDIEDVKPQRSGIFYDDVRQKQFNFPGLKQGAITSIDYDQDIKDPHFLGSFLFQSYIPIHEAQYSVTFPEDVKVKYFVRDDNKILTFSQSTSRHKTTYTWRANAVKSVKYFSDAPELTYYAPHVAIYIDSYNSDGVKTKVFSDVNQYFSWAYNNIKDINRQTDKHLKALTDSLVNGITDETEKTRKIYYWVQENIKYIAFEDGMGGFIPRPASLVFERKFGDCKDKSSILNEMLKYAGVTSYLTLIGTRDIPYTYAQLPTSNSDNHMIVALQDKQKQWLFLDGTNNSLPYGYSPYNIQGKEALILIDSTKHEVVEVPVIAKEKNFRLDSLSISINGRSILGSGKTYIGGLYRVSLSSDFAYVSEKEKSKSMEEVMRFGNSKCIFDSITYSGLDNFSDTLSISTRFNIPEYVQTVDNKLYLNANLFRAYQNDLIELDKRFVDKEFQYKFLSTQSIALLLPEKYKLTKLPPGGSFDNGTFGYKVTYELKNNTVVMNRTLYVDTLLLPVSRFKEWNDFIKSLSDVYGQVLVLQK